MLCVKIRGDQQSIKKKNQTSPSGSNKHVMLKVTEIIL